MLRWKATHILMYASCLPALPNLEVSLIGLLVWFVVLTNNEQRRVRIAQRTNNDRPTACGAIAQLGERLPCTQEVSGSIPLGSTIIFLFR